jgi:PAT family beta-lactamase induction signal transducer AmpG
VIASPHSPLPKSVFLYILNLLRPYADRRVLAIGCIAYANGLPLLLTAKTLGVWLETFGLNYTSIGLFGLLHLPYTLKFMWAPILDHVPLPFLNKWLGQRRSWLCLTQVTAIAGLLTMITFDPVANLIPFVACGFVVTISAASQHVLLLTYQIETLSSRNWGVGEAMSVFAYRMAILTGGAGALYLTTFLSWKEVYTLLAFFMFSGLIAVLVMREPPQFESEHAHSFTKKWDWIHYALIGPFKDFICQRGWLTILVFMVIYRLPENLLGMMQTLFLLNLGFSKTDISSVAAIFGLGATIFGGFIGGHWIRTYGYKHTLYWAALAHGLSCILFIILSALGPNLPFLYFTIGVEHVFSGAALTGFFTYQLTCCSLRYAATQLALLTSLAGLSRTVAPTLAGWMIDSYGWTPYLTIVLVSSIPGVLWVKRLPFSKD